MLQVHNILLKLCNLSHILLAKKIGKTFPWRHLATVYKLFLNATNTAQFNVVVETNTNRLIEAMRNKTPK